MGLDVQVFESAFAGQLRTNVWIVLNPVVGYSYIVDDP